MKTYYEFTEDTKLNENALRTFGAVAVTVKVNSLYNQILQIKYLRTDKEELFNDKLFKKIDLLAQQNRTLAVLIAGLNLTTGGNR